MENSIQTLSLNVLLIGKNIFAKDFNFKHWNPNILN